MPRDVLEFVWRRVRPLHDHQLPPERAGDDWTTWLVLGGRGAGKTRAGAEWVMGLALGFGRLDRRAGGPHRARRRDLRRRARRHGRGPGRPARRSTSRGERPAWSPTRRKLEWRERRRRACVLGRGSGYACAGRNSTPPGATSSPNGAMSRRPGTCCSSGLRLGARPREIVTTTPRPIPLLQAAARRSERVAVSRAATRGQRRRTSRRPSSTRSSGATPARGSGARSSTARWSRSAPDALWTRDAIEAAARRARAAARAHRRRGRPAGLVGARRRCLRHRRGGRRRGRRRLRARRRDGAGPDAAGLGAARGRALPPARGRRARRRDEPGRRDGRGGDAPGRSRRAGDAGARDARQVSARRAGVGRSTSKGRVHHVGAFPALEDEMCDFGLGGLSSRALARPPRRARLGAVRADAAGAGGSRG